MTVDTNCLISKAPKSRALETLVGITSDKHLAVFAFGVFRPSAELGGELVGGGGGVGGEELADEGDGAEDFDGFRTFNSEAGVTIALIVRSPDKTLVGFDSGKAGLKVGGAEATSRFFGNNAFKAAHQELILALESWTGREDTRIKVDLDAGLSVR